MSLTLEDLEKRIAEATGPDRNLDRAVAAALEPSSGNNPAKPYTSSVDTCLALIGTVLPHWHWHVGHGPSGILPYASLSRDTGRLRVEAGAPTVPLALLYAAVKALIAETGNPS